MIGVLPARMADTKLYSVMLLAGSVPIRYCKFIMELQPSVEAQLVALLVSTD